MGNTVGLAAIGTTVHESGIFDYAVLTPGIYTLVFGDVSVLIDFNSREVTAEFAVTDHEDHPAPVVMADESIVANVGKFQRMADIYDKSGV